MAPPDQVTFTPPSAVAAVFNLSKSIHFAPCGETVTERECFDTGVGVEVPSPKLKISQCTASRLTIVAHSASQGQLYCTSVYPKSEAHERKSLLGQASVGRNLPFPQEA